MNRALSVAVIWVSTWAGQVDVLDLTQARPSSHAAGSESADLGTGSAVGFASGSRSGRLNLQLKVESLDADTYLDGQEFEFRLSLRNTGDRTIALPWEPDPKRVVTDQGTPMLQVLIAVSAEGSSQRLTIPVAVLYGSTMSPMTMKQLRPGDRAEIVARSNWNFMGYSSEELRARGVPPRLKMFSELRFLTAFSGQRYETVESTNRIPIVLGRRN
jgi:hypothetical protein